MSDDKLQKRLPLSVREKGQYVLAFSVVASMLLVTGFNVFVVFFFGLFAYFILKMFSSTSRSDTREIFEFYLTANEILRDDERRWYGFEIHDAIFRGESIIQRMPAAPPLVSFTLGALNNKVGEHAAAVRYLSQVLEHPQADEASYVYPSPELRNYVKVLRKIEREPADAPMTSAAVRALERARKIRGKVLLEESRAKVLTLETAPAETSKQQASNNGDRKHIAVEAEVAPQPPFEVSVIESSDEPVKTDAKKTNRKQKDDPYANRKPITEVLHDIYDSNIQ